MAPRLSEHLRRRSRLAALASLVASGWLAFGLGQRADEGNAEASLAAALAAEVEVDRESVQWWGAEGPLRFRPAVFRGRVASSEPADVYFVAARLGSDGEVLALSGLRNLTRSGSADEGDLVRVGPHHVAYATRVGDRFDAFSLIDLRGEPANITDGWPRRARWQNAISNLQEMGRSEGFGITRFALKEPANRVELSVEGDTLVASIDGARVRVDVGGPQVVEGAALLEVQKREKGMPGTITWVVDTVRDLPFVGPEPIAWLESRVFAVKDFLERTYYTIAGPPDAAQEVAAELGVTMTERETRRRAELAVTDPELGWPPAPIEPIIDTPARGEGEWIAIADDPFVRSYPNAPPAFYSTFLQVDPERPFTRVYLAVWDPRAVQLRIMSGTREPESATGATAPGMIPRDPETLSRVVAGFNGGFQSLHGEFGMMSEGRVYLPPKPWAATVGVHDDGHVSMGSWRGPPEGIRYYAERWAVAQIPEDMVEFRQNLTSVVEGDRWNPWRRWYWGAAPQGDEEQVFIDRSGLCLTREGFLVYFWGKSMGAEELGKAMLAARCVRGLHLDMNQRHTAFELYNVYPRSQPPAPLERPLDEEMEFEITVPYARDWRVRGRKLVRSMTPMTFPRYIRRDPRDFFYLMLRPVLPGPHLEGLAHGEGVFDTAGLPHAGWPHAFARAWLGAPPDVEGERTWLVRIDATRAVPQNLWRRRGGGDRPPRPLGYLTGARAQEGGPLALYAERQLIGCRYRVGRPPDGEGITVVLTGTPLEGSGAEAAIGVDGDGFLVYAEGPAERLPTDLRTARVEQALALPEGVRLAFVLPDLNVGPDAFERPVDPATAIALMANEDPATELLFPDVEPRPYMYWGPMQDSRVRYFRGEGPRRFTAPDAGAGR